MSARSLKPAFFTLLILLTAGGAEAQPLSSNALPGVERLPLASVATPRAIGVAVTGGYALSEPQGSQDSVHHRQLADLAGGLAIVPWLRMGLQLEERYDAHPASSPDGFDDGTVLDARATARASVRIDKAWLAGVDVIGWLPGAEDAGDSWSSLSVDTRLLLTSEAAKLGWGAAAGYRLDRSAENAPPSARLSRGDRFALSASSFDAVLVGLGGFYDFGAWLAKAEVSADILVGGDAPSASSWPARLLIGAQRELGSGFSLDASTQLGLTATRSLDAVASLVPYEPRWQTCVGIRWSFEPNRPVSVPRPAPPQPIVTPPPPREPPKTAFELVLLDEENQPVTGAKVTLEIEGKPYEVPDLGGGRYRVDGLPLGAARLRAEAEAIAPIDEAVTLGDKPTGLQRKAAAPPVSAQLRGMVRSFTGKPVLARIRVEPLSTQVSTDAGGNFQVDVPPGDYTIIISAPGFVEQRRAVKVQKRGVVVLNADLVRSR